MPAAYDTYNYPTYWKDRGYEHIAEGYAIKKLLDRIPFTRSILEIGAGYGRLLPAYRFKSKKIILSDPSGKLLKVAREANIDPKIEFIQSSLENLESKIKPKSIDLIIMVRVLHHIEDLERCFHIINRLLTPKGFLILEYANKRHFKANVKEFFKGNITYPLDITTKEVVGSKGSEGSLPFYNYHPYQVENTLKKENFRILERRSVSNIRSRTIKKIIPTPVLIWLEKLAQTRLARFDFGPSIFVLARKNWQ